MSTKYKMYMTYDNGGQKLTFPVLPEKFTIQSGSSNESVEVDGLGEITIFQDRPALTISFDGYFPAGQGAPKKYISKLKKWKQAKKPVHFILTGGAAVNLYCSIEELTYYEQGGDVGTLYYSLSLKEYREVTIRQVTVSDNVGTVSGASGRVDNRVQASTYTVVSGDYLYRIAQQQLGDSSRWKEIATLNSIASPYTIYVNQILKLPG